MIQHLILTHVNVPEDNDCRLTLAILTCIKFPVLTTLAILENSIFEEEKITHIMLALRTHMILDSVPNGLVPNGYLNKQLST